MKAKEASSMNKAVTILAIAAVLAVVLISGCTQQPSGPVTGGAVNKAAESAAQSAIEQEMNQAIENISTSDIENALLNQ
jgi:outer membrane lipoprotein-sorting protein